MSTTTQPPKPKRRWYQFGLRTLLLVMLVSCFAFAWIGVRLQRASENRDRVAAVEKPVAEIEKLGVMVVKEYEQLRSPTWLEALFDDPGDEDDPTGVLTVSDVDFFEGDATDADLEHVKSLTHLKNLNLRSTNVTDAGLEHLKWLTKLEDLRLGDTNVTDTGMEHLKGLTNLEALHIGQTNISNAGLEHLKGLTSLQFLDLTNTDVTDAGLENLSGLTQLKLVLLDGTQVTDEGVEKLQQALPNCHIW